jgi:hypothetical protein
MKKERFMKTLGKAFAVVALGCMMSQMCGCVSSSLVDIWRDPSFKAAPLSKILVIAIRKDAIIRRIWEDAFAGELEKYGVATTSSYSLFPDAPPDTNQVIATVQANGFDGILVILRLSTQTNRQYIQGYTSTVQQEHYSYYWQRYWTTYRDIEHPGYVDSQTVDLRTIDVTATANNGRLIWSATSRTPDPGSVMDAQRGIAGLVISELAKRSIIISKK